MLKRLEADEIEQVESEQGEADALLPPVQTIAELDRSSDSDSEVDVKESAVELVEECGSWFDIETKAFLCSMLVHMGLIVGLAAITVSTHREMIETLVFKAAAPLLEEPDFNIQEDLAAATIVSDAIGNNSIGDAASALSMAPTISDVSQIVTPDVHIPSPYANLDLSVQVKQASGLVQSKRVVRGNTGTGVTGTDGAVDRVTFELLQSIEERPTLVVWLFDASVSLIRRRDEIRSRLDRIYEELGIVQAIKRKQAKDNREEEPLLTSVISFGKTVDLLTKTPTAELKDIQEAIDGIEIDVSGVEMTFSAIYLAADRYKALRNMKSSKGPERNVVLIVVTDERGDDPQGLEKSIEICRKFAIPVHVLGVPAPFGRDFTYIKYVDPDPKYDQSPQWAQIDQGPETLYPERVRLGYAKNYYEEPTIDSGFGPYAISRICYETGGIYFTIHSSRRYNAEIRRDEIEAFSSRLNAFFDPEIMSRYRPDYLSEEEYIKQVSKSPLRSSLLQASKLARADVLDKPRTVFLRRDEPGLIRDLTKAQEEAARLEPALLNLVSVLQIGEAARAQEKSPRWLASFDLSYAISLAAKVRTETYNLMLAKAKRGMPFSNPQNNTWTLVASDEVSVSSKLEKEAELARKLFKDIQTTHPGTPWAFLAQKEQDHLVGWSWKDSKTEVAMEGKKEKGKNDNPPRMREDEKAKMLKPPMPKRPIPKL
ncbi:MAG: vWA domain-containing protein [Pirellulaceae bacterium]|nr:vWA domain-containing protein [Pirellulaceae bacterium]